MEFDAPKPLALAGLTWTPKRVVSDDRGSVKLMLKEGQFDFPVGEIYFSTIKPGVIKGWKLHKIMWQRFSVPTGDVKFVFVDDRLDSSTRGDICEFASGNDNYGVITVPPGLWYSFRCESSMPAIIANVASISRQVGESDTIGLDQFKQYMWQ